MNEMKMNNEKEIEALSFRLLEKRTVLLFGKVDEKKACEVISAMLYLEDCDGEKPIILYINSEGGAETDILAIYDVMKKLRCTVETVCVGKAHGLSALVLAGGTKGSRKAYANSEIMLSQVQRDRTFGQASDIELETEHLLKVKERINGLLAALCQKDTATIKNDLERKHWLFAEEAKAYGLIDEVIE